jgi:hypothetical protein
MKRNIATMRSIRWKKRSQTFSWDESYWMYTSSLYAVIEGMFVPVGVISPKRCECQFVGGVRISMITSQELRLQRLLTQLVFKTGIVNKVNPITGTIEL